MPALRRRCKSRGSQEVCASDVFRILLETLLGASCLFETLLWARGVLVVCVTETIGLGPRALLFFSGSRSGHVRVSPVGS